MFAYCFINFFLRNFDNSTIYFIFTYTHNNQLISELHVMKQYLIVRKCLLNFGNIQSSTGFKDNGIARIFFFPFGKKRLVVLIQLLYGSLLLLCFFRFNLMDKLGFFAGVCRYGNHYRYARFSLGLFSSQSYKFVV